MRRQLGPEVVARFRVNQLHVHPKAVVTTSYRTFEHIADDQLASQLFYISGFALEGECGIARDHERAMDARQVCGQALRHAINEIVMLGIAAEVSEREYDDRKARR